MPSPSSIEPKRALSLDALRGFAILTMVLSGTVPYTGLPAWMYHAQLPPPTRQFDPSLPGMTWVDLVFPFFLFTLGAAIPLALGKLIEKGQSTFKIIIHILERGFLLGFFAIFLRHVRPHSINPSPDTLAWLTAIFGFILMFGLFTRWPESWKKEVRWSIKIGSWMATIILLSLLRYPDGSGFSLGRSDIIIVVLTNVYIFGSLIWLFTRQNWLPRLGILGILIALRLAQAEPGWVAPVWNFSLMPWMYKLYYLQYLFIVIPGTIVGDMAVQWMKNKTETEGAFSQWSLRRYGAITILMMAFIVLQLVGLQARWVWETVLITLALFALGYHLLRQPGNDSERLIQRLYGWGVYLLFTGLIFEPFEGGIKKDHSTVSYYLVTAGLAIFIMIAFFILIDILNRKRWLNLLIFNGQNPMIAYVGFANFIWPILALTGLEGLINSFTAHPWLGFIRGATYTFILALLVSYFSKKRIFWRT